MSDEKMNVLSKAVGRKVAFVDGPNAGQVRVIPDADGEFVQSGDFVYRIVPFRMKMSGYKDTPTMWFAFDEQEHPIRLLFKMWEEYSIAAQIRGGMYGHANRAGDRDIKSRS